MRSAAWSHLSFSPVRSEMLPRLPTVAKRWPYSKWHEHGRRDFLRIEPFAVVADGARQRFLRQVDFLALCGDDSQRVVAGHESRIRPLEHDSEPLILKTMGIGVGVAPNHEKLGVVFLVLVGDVERVGDFAVIGEGIPASDRRDRLGALTSMAQCTRSTIWQQKSVKMPPP